MKKKIIFIIGVLSVGGAERVISLLAKEFCNRGFEVDVITIYGNKNDYIDDKRIHIYPIHHNFKNKYFRFFEIIYKIRCFVRKQRPYLVISFVAIINIYTILACALIKTKLIVSERNDPYQNPENGIIRKLRNILYRCSDGIVFQTNDAMKYFSEKIQKKGCIIPNPIKVNLPFWDEDKTDKSIITACRLVKQKNLPMLINAFSKLKEEFTDYKLKIYGVGILHNELLRQIYELGLENEISLPGFSNSIHDAMKKSELFVISSDYEGISNSMLEALAIGVPVVSTDSPIGGARMFITDGENGLLTEVGNTEELYQAMKKIISDKKFACSLSKEAKKIREELSPEVVVEKWNEFIVKVCDANTK